jgi:hypothetical protein
MRNLGGARFSVVNSDVPDALEDPGFGKYFASFGFSHGQQLEEVHTDDMFFTVSMVLILVLCLSSILT